MYKYLFFDFDGTLINTNNIIKYILNETCEKFCARKMTQEDFEQIFGKISIHQMQHFSIEYAEDMVVYYKKRYKELQDTMTESFAGTAEMLQQLDDLDCKMAIVSSKGTNGIRHGLEMLNLTKYFKVIISAYDVQNHKPHPEPVLKAMDLLGATKELSLIIGDSPYDILCGKNAHIKTAMVSWSIFPVEAIKKTNPDYWINTTSDLIDICK